MKSNNTFPCLIRLSVLDQTGGGILGKPGLVIKGEQNRNLNYVFTIDSFLVLLRLGIKIDKRKFLLESLDDLVHEHKHNGMKHKGSCHE